MATVAQNLLALDAVKDDIKAKIGTNLGRTIGAAVPFTDYADYILPPVAWMPDPLWASLDDIADGQIGMIVRDRDDLGVAARCAFTVTATAAYVVDWGDGTAPETVTSTVMADHTYTLGTGTADSKGTTTFKVRISSTGTITRIQMAGTVTGGVVKQTVQFASIKASGITSMANAFQHCYLLQSCTMVSLPLCTTASSAFMRCAGIVTIGNISMATCTSIANMFQDCTSMIAVGAISFPLCTNASAAFYACGSLVSTGAVSLPACTNISAMFESCRKLTICTGGFSGIGVSAASVDATTAFLSCNFDGVVDLSSAKLYQVRTSGLAERLSNVTGLTFHASSVFGGASPQINVGYTMMGRTALVALFNLLPTLVGKTINITGCIGTADLTAGDRAIATGKGWTITG